MSQAQADSSIAILPDTRAKAVQIRGLKKRYGSVQAVDGIDLDVAAGETFGFLGPNGAGKSTTINILCTLALPSAGTAEVAGFDVVAQRAAVRRQIGLVCQESTLDGYLTGEQNLRFHGELYGVRRSGAAARREQVLRMVGLWERRGDEVNKYSGGMRRRLEIARGLLHSPSVLFLDEPTIGLDPETRRSIWSYLDKLRETERTTVFVTTHYMDEAEHCDRIAIINEGRIAALDTPERLKAGAGADLIQIRTYDDIEAMRRLQERIGLDAAFYEGVVTISVPEAARFIPRLFAELGMEIRSVTVRRPTLDDVYLSHLGSTSRDASASSGSTPWASMVRRAQ